MLIINDLQMGGGEIMKIKVLEFMSNPLKISTFASSRVPSLTWKQTHFGTHFFFRSFLPTFLLSNDATISALALSMTSSLKEAR